MATEGSSAAQVIEQKAAEMWSRLAGRFEKGATAKQKAAEDAAKKAREEAPKPPAAPDPRVLLLSRWIATDPATVTALLSIIDEMIQLYGAQRREAVASHAYMAYHEGECAALSELRTKLTNLSGQGKP